MHVHIHMCLFPMRIKFDKLHACMYFVAANGCESQDIDGEPLVQPALAADANHVPEENATADSTAGPTGAAAEIGATGLEQGGESMPAKAGATGSELEDAGTGGPTAGPEQGGVTSTDAGTGTPGGEPEGGKDDSWRRDKRGQLLNGQALYMRFYRSLRSPKQPVPEEVKSKMAEASDACGGRSRMHTLYLHFLACRGQWKESSLVMSAYKRSENQTSCSYEWWGRSKMVAELGAELADDLIQRHKDTEAKMPASRRGHYIKRHPDFPDREELWRYKNFLGYLDLQIDTTGSAAELNTTADIVEDEFFGHACPRVVCFQQCFTNTL